MAIVSHLKALEAQKIINTFPIVLKNYLQDLSRETSPIAKEFRALASGNKLERNLGEGLKAIEQCYMSTTRENAIIETHRRFIDFQLIFEGEELMETTFASLLQVKTPYDAERDLTVYQESAPLHLLRMTEENFAIFKPEDAHRSTLQVSTSSLVRKVVIKIPI